MTDRWARDTFQKSTTKAAHRVDYRAAQARKKIATDFLASTAEVEPYLTNGLMRLWQWADGGYKGSP